MVYFIFNTKIFILIIYVLNIFSKFNNNFLLNSFFKKKTKFLFILNILIFLLFNNVCKSSTENKKEIEKIGIDYLNSRKELEDYIIDTGDTLRIVFYPSSELSNDYTINPEGEIILPRLEETFVRGLTISELTILLEKKYLKYLNNPRIKIYIQGFKEINFLISGEVRNPGIYTFPRVTSSLSRSFLDNEISNNESSPDIESIQNINVKDSNKKIPTISKAIRKAGGITKLSDLSKIKLTRDIPIGKGKGTKTLNIDLKPFLDFGSTDNDLRLFDGDKIYIPKLSKKSDELIPKSILGGLSPRFINIEVYGRVDSPGRVQVPLTASLSDIFDLSGPIKPLSGKVHLIRYENDGTVERKKISFSSNAMPGSKRNPFLKNGDKVAVKNSFLGRYFGTVKELTEPVIGIYTTKELIDSFNE